MADSTEVNRVAFVLWHVLEQTWYPQEEEWLALSSDEQQRWIARANRLLTMLDGGES